MKDTSQVQNAEDLMVLYEELTFLVSQLNNDAPKIKKMYASLEQTIAQQETVAAKAAQTVEAAASTISMGVLGQPIPAIISGQIGRTSLSFTYSATAAL